ncbi:MAG: MBL fold metallo-hydrolase [Alphaproteobacteria bacterium]|nr:MBL fold metallo-hydrolase [Alphaproteobacteria bacterium]
MATPLPFNRDLTFTYGEADRLSPLVRRVIARNPSPFTFHGTGTYIIGHGRVGVIDPGPLDAAHVDAILNATRGETITHLLITHTHNDHSPAAAPLKARTGALTYAYGPHGSLLPDDGIKTEEDGDGGFMPDHAVRHGMRIAGEGWTVQCIFTPGHTSNHMSYALLEENAVFPGDHVMGWSTTVVSPPDGDMSDYMNSLAHLASRNDSVYYPTHGAPIGGPNDTFKRNPQEFVRGLIAHRLDREAQIGACLSRGVGRIPDMVKEIYAAVDPRLHPAAALSVHAHLIRMVKDGRARTPGEAVLSAIYGPGTTR